jgi:hypothetical protein
VAGLFSSDGALFWSAFRRLVPGRFGCSLAVSPEGHLQRLLGEHRARRDALLEALPEVVRAVRGQCEVLMDGGIRRDTDVLKALALAGRPTLGDIDASQISGLELIPFCYGM